MRFFFFTLLLAGIASTNGWYFLPMRITSNWFVLELRILQSFCLSRRVQITVFWSKCRTHCHFEAVSLEELDTWIRAPSFHRLFYYVRNIKLTVFRLHRIGLTRIRWWLRIHVSGYSPFFRDCFKVAGYSAVKSSFLRENNANNSSIG